MKVILDEKGLFVVIDENNNKETITTADVNNSNYKEICDIAINAGIEIDEKDITIKTARTIVRNVEDNYKKGKLVYSSWKWVLKGKNLEGKEIFTPAQIEDIKRKRAEIANNIPYINKDKK